MLLKLDFLQKYNYIHQTPQIPKFPLRRLGTNPRVLSYIFVKDFCCILKGQGRFLHGTFILSPISVAF